MARAEDEDTPYFETERLLGAGPYRIGSAVLRGEDLYSMYFASTLRPELVYYHIEVAPTLKKEEEEEGKDKDNISRTKTEEAFDLGDAGDKNEASTSEQPGSGDEKSPEEHKKRLNLMDFKMLKERTNLLSKTMTIFIF